MFGWFKKKSVPPDLDAQIKAIFDVCVEALKRTWRGLDHPRTTTIEELAGEINGFSVAAFRFMFTRFPITKEAPRELLWMAIFTAVLEAKTHPVDDVNKAISLLEAQYAS